MELVVVGLNHKTAPIALRERVAFASAEAEEILRSECDLDRHPERMLLSTCNRTELYLLTHDAAAGRDAFLKMVERHRGIDLGSEASALYVREGRAMATHLFRVASSIDSMMVGEVQILGQVHEAFEIARRSGAAGPLLHRLLDGAFRVGKRVRSETEISVGAVSVAYAAVSLATRIFVDLKERSALLIGSGETGELAARHLQELGIGRLLVTNRTAERAAEVAGRLGARAIPFEQIDETMVETSIIVTATASPIPILTLERVRRAVAARDKRTLLIVDIAVPRDVEPAVAELPNLFLYDIDALEGLVAENLKRREREIPKVEAIIEQELEKFFAWFVSLGVAPVIRDLRERFEAIRAAELERHAGRLPDGDREEVEAITRGIVNKLLHEPMVNIRAFQREGPSALARLDTVRRLFGLKGERDGSD